MATITTFLKFGCEENIYDLLHNGTIYMNSIQHFRLFEDKELRGDIYEGASRITNCLPGEFEIPEIGFKGNYLNIHIREAFPEVLGNIYSLYCISSHGWGNPLEFEINQKVKEFGTHCLMVKNSERFLELIEEKLTEAGVKYSHGFVDYYDRMKISRKVNLFEKPMEFEYQKEFRFYVEREAIDPFVISIGNMENIAKVYSTDFVVDGLRLQMR
ncbi:hypothetical protein F0919_00740 [Taibaiella lutea]|uniref:Uncharacterized protein n=1 Tax=Taibaiella lutea TaxID=2608001 RepID=A0A5M6CT74_9BACT|nr:hypothetical protein [Taibaiella lutea]KAA5536225.1 hypothetical protein F0919_00740 [Taibaiella lutea]